MPKHGRDMTSLYVVREDEPVKKSKEEPALPPVEMEEPAVPKVE